MRKNAEKINIFADFVRWKPKNETELALFVYQLHSLMVLILRKHLGNI